MPEIVQTVLTLPKRRATTPNVVARLFFFGETRGCDGSPRVNRTESRRREPGNTSRPQARPSRVWRGAPPRPEPRGLPLESPTGAARAAAEAVPCGRSEEHT